MQSARQILDRQYLEMRWRCLSLAADLDRVQRGAGGPSLLQAEPRLRQLHQAIRVLGSDQANRAEQVQMIFSDTTPPPQRS
jgi:hypothetical protein